MAGEGDKRKKKLLQEFKDGPKTLEYLMEKYNVKESSVKHDVVELKKQGFSILGTPKKGWYMDSSAESEEETFYESSFKRDVAQLVVLLILQKSDRPMSVREIAKEYADYSYQGSIDRGHIEERLEKNILPNLQKTRMVIKDANGSYIVGKEAPVNLTLSEDDALDVLEKIEIYGKTHPFSIQLENVYRKLVRAYYNDDELDSGEKFEVLGRSFARTADAESIYKKIEEIPYERYVVNITYRDRYGESSEFRFKTGLVTYVADKDRMYMIGQKCDDDHDMVILVNRIEAAEVTDEPNNLYASVHYMDIFYDMFSISTDPLQKVKIRFVDQFNIMDKLRNKFKYRTKCTITRMDDYIYYEDEVRGVKDLAKLLRSFGSSMEVLEPPELREMMLFSARRTIERYRKAGIVNE